MSVKSEKLILKKKVFAYYLRNPDVKFHKYHSANREFPKHHATIKKWIEEMKKLEENGEKIEKTYKTKINRENAAVFEFLSQDGELTVELITLLKAALKAKAINAEDDRFTSIRDLATAYGVVIDKEIALNRLNNDAARLDIERKRYDLEKEKLQFEREKLEQKIANPEMFVPKVIINNDAPMHEKPDMSIEKYLKDETN
jgi:hypothetical protein